VRSTLSCIFVLYGQYHSDDDNENIMSATLVCWWSLLW